MGIRTNGFSIIELLIVIVIIGIIAALSIAGFMASKRSANEGSMISTLRLLHVAQLTYSSTFGLGEYAGDVGGGTQAGLETLSDLNIIDRVIGTGTKSGYNYIGGRQQFSATNAAQYFFSAIPVSANPITGTGNHRLGISTDGILKSDSNLTVHYTNVGEVIDAPALVN